MQYYHIELVVAVVILLLKADRRPDTFQSIFKQLSILLNFKEDEIKDTFLQYNKLLKSHVELRNFL